MKKEDKREIISWTWTFEQHVQSAVLKDVSQQLHHIVVTCEAGNGKCGEEEYLTFVQREAL